MWASRCLPFSPVRERTHLALTSVPVRPVGTHAPRFATSRAGTTLLGCKPRLQEEGERLLQASPPRVWPCASLLQQPCLWPATASQVAPRLGGRWQTSAVSGPCGRGLCGAWPAPPAPGSRGAWMDAVPRAAGGMPQPLPTRLPHPATPQVTASGLGATVSVSETELPPVPSPGWGLHSLH